MPENENEQNQGTPPEPSKVFIDETEWVGMKEQLANLQGKVSTYEALELRLGQQHPETSQPAPQPVIQPEFQFHSEEDLQKALDEGDLKNYHKMNKHNTEVLLQKNLWELRTNEIAPLRTTGSQALSDLSGRFASQAMKHLDVPEVKKTYEQRLTQMKTTGQVITPEVHQNIYEWAVGTHVDKVQEKIQQGLLRDQSTQVNTPTSTTGRGAASAVITTPPVEEVYDTGALQQLTRKYPGLSPAQAADREFSRHGGWDGYYKKFYGAKKEGGTK
jgi:hypothetical protein